MGAFEGFSLAVRRWFEGQFAAPTAVQLQAWDTIDAGKNALVIAPTGSGKTLAAFLCFIDRIAQEKARAATEGRPWPKGVRALYVSPLKALGADVERNLQAPLAAIGASDAADADAAAAVTCALRTGDTSPAERRAIVRTPPDILITTPESLYLMLTSKAAEVLSAVQAVIVDEIHALAGSKRGAHLSLSLERLDDLLPAPAQRIGLSATVRPPQVVARFLGGIHPVEIIAQEHPFQASVKVVSPVPDMTAIAGVPRAAARAPRRAPSEVAWKSDRALRAAMGQGAVPAASGSPEAAGASPSIWPHIEAAILDQVLAHRSTIVFVNSRGLCEKLTARLNALYSQRLGATASPQEGAPYRSDMGGSSDLAQPADAVIARAHHGSVAKEVRRQVELSLKRGELPCVVATSSLELGIDMGQVDLVLQVAPPPSVASGLQRIGRANHQVRGRSAAVIYPRTRPEVIDAAVVVESMAEGAIEPLSLVSNPLDVLAQQTVAAVALRPWQADQWLALVRRSANFADLPQSAFEATLSMLAGVMNSGDLAEFRPRIVWDRGAGTLEGRPGSQRLAVTAAGTIPDRGLFPVMLPQGDGAGKRRRVGEMDEEMAWESRVGDVIALGTSTWRITEITQDRVMVEPAPGRTARLPFWHGEVLGRSFSLGCARGAFVRRALDALTKAGEGKGACGDPAFTPVFQERVETLGLNEFAVANLASLLALQRAATGAVPTDRVLVVERCEDELGEARIILHSPFGRAVHEPWALALSWRIEQEQGVKAQIMAADDGIAIILPAQDCPVVSPDVFRFDADEVRRIVTGAVSSTSLFAARFRECAARALLMTPTQPGKRAPLWQQRQKAGRLLEAARREGDFPLLAETARECLQDVYDLEALATVMKGLEAGAITLVSAQTAVPSPFAAPLIFGFVGDHLYEGDLPHAESRASMLAVDPGVLGELLGSAPLLELLDPRAVKGTEEELQRTASGWRARGIEGAFDLLRELGPLTAAELGRRLEGGVAAAEEALVQLERDHRAFLVEVGKNSFWACGDDAPRLAAVLGVAAPSWAQPVRGGSAGQAESGALDGLVARFARTHGVFSAQEAADRFGLGPVLVEESLVRLRDQGRVVFLGATSATSREQDRDEGTALAFWADSDVLQRLRSRSLALARQAAQPVAPAVFERFLLSRQGVALAGTSLAADDPLEALAEVIAQFEGVFLPALQWESQVFPLRVPDCGPALLDELLGSGEVLWVGRRMPASSAAASSAAASGRRRQGTGEVAGASALQVAFFPADSPLAPLPVALAEDPWAPAMPEPGEESLPDVAPGSFAALKREAARLLSFEGPLTFQQLAQALGADDRFANAAADHAAQALADLAAEGRVASDQAAFIRAGGQVSFGGRDAALAPDSREGEVPRVRTRRTSNRYAQARRQARSQAMAAVHGRMARNDALAGRWMALAPSQVDGTLSALAIVEGLLDRYGVVNRDVAVLAEVPGGMTALYPVLRAMEQAGDVLRGVFVEGMELPQFAAREVIESLRQFASMDEKDGVWTVLPVEDPANLWGAALPWPKAMPAPVEGAVGPTRRAGGLLVLHNGAPVLFAAAHLKALWAFAQDGGVLGRAARILADFVVARARRARGAALREKLVVQTFNGAPVLASSAAAFLEEAGFVRQPNGLRLYVPL